MRAGWSRVGRRVGRAAALAVCLTAAAPAIAAGQPAGQASQPLAQPTGTRDFLFGRPRGWVAVRGSWLMPRAEAISSRLSATSSPSRKTTSTRPAVAGEVGLALTSRLSAAAGFEFSKQDDLRPSTAATSTTSGSRSTSRRRSRRPTSAAASRSRCGAAAAASAASRSSLAWSCLTRAAAPACSITSSNSTAISWTSSPSASSRHVPIGGLGAKRPRLRRHRGQAVAHGVPRSGGTVRLGATARWDRISSASTASTSTGSGSRPASA